ncbi:Rv3654c family TadE-like protein [Bifidobacterium bohemicum]|nr:Rv3654c family TadE-like protein [Bifidobacterium bohemicum]
MSRLRGSDEGSGTANGVMLIAVIGVLMSVAAVGGHLMIVSSRAQSAADQAAIAGAEAAWREAPNPCLNSANAALLNAGTVISCTVDDQDVIVKVQVRTSVPIVDGITKRARAGPEDCT